MALLVAKRGLAMSKDEEISSPRERNLDLHRSLSGSLIKRSWSPTRRSVGG